MNLEKCQERHSREYQTLMDNIPGGILQCLNDEYFTLVEVNQVFLELVGYSREEISTCFHDHFIELVEPQDRERVLQEARSQLNTADRIVLSYRVIGKDGSCKWVTDNARQIDNDQGEPRIYRVILDDTQAHQGQEALRLSLERHQIIMNQTTDIVFEWNLLEDTMIYSSNWEKKFGYAPHYSGMKQMNGVFRYIHPDDVATLKTLMTDTQKGIDYATAEIRIQHANGRYLWCRIRATLQMDSQNKPFKAVGVITDIDEEKEMIEDLRRRAERDALTGLYNREETVRKICRHLKSSPQEQSALLMIDIDNFKLVNDRHGHLFGDAVLSELAAVMKKLMRPGDVVGRIGGDEFMIYLKSVTSQEAVGKLTESLISLIQHLFQEEKQLVEVTCSMGAAVYPQAGQDFQALYNSADLALYQAKSQGKNQVVFYDNDNTLPMDQAGYSSLGAAIDSDQRTAGVPGDLVNYVFQILYDSNDIDHAIQLILEIVGKRFDVSRAYIFENSEDGRFADNTYEWCNDGVHPEKDQLQHVPYDGLDDYESLFRDNAIFYCRDIHSLTPAQAALLENQGICSTLQCAIRDGQEFRGFVGFDECTGLRMWTKEEIGMLSLISQLLTTFLQKKRASDRDHQLVLQLNTILDVQDAYIYAIVQGTYELLYLNRKTRQLDPTVRPGMTCHKAFFGKDQPCATCPLGGGNGEIYNPQYAVWTRVQVAPMKWAENDAYLLSCFDITEYKRMQTNQTAE